MLWKIEQKLDKKIIFAGRHDFCESVRPILEKEGCKVCFVNCAREFIAMLKSEKYDLALIDFFMLEMSGRELMEKVKKAEIKRPKFIFMNVAHFGAKGMEELRRLGISGYINDINNKNLSKSLNEIR